VIRSVLAIVAVLALAAPARAHDFRPGVLALREISAGVFAIAWTEPVDTRRSTRERVSIRFPEHCERAGNRLSCGARGLEGAIVFRDMPDPRARVVVSVDSRGSAPFEAVVTGESPRVELGSGESFLDWIGIGLEHIAFGLDHVLFVLGLLLAIGFERRIVLAITAFTLAHSITLALAVFDLVHLPSAPVEAAIAASVVLVAREGLTRGDSLAQRAPWLVALVFGLVHGLGFAGALREVGLPERALGRALFGFNLGVELGQLAIVGLAVGAAYIAKGVYMTRASGFRDRLRRTACYGIGAVAAFWLVERTIAIVTPS
jgi:hypothetical protein